MLPIPALVSRTTSDLLLLQRRDGSRPLPTSGIIAIAVVVGLAVLSVTAGAIFYVLRRRRRRTRNTQEDRWRGSFVPNNFKVVGGIYSHRPSISPSRTSSSSSGNKNNQHGSSLSASSAAAPYNPTTDYGQYMPPIPKSIYNPNRAPSLVRPHNPANLVRHARDKSLPLLP